MLATDVSAKRLAQMQARLRRYAYAERVKCAVADAAEEKNVRGEFDLILCDVPCSGTGTLAGNPEIRHRLKVEELTRQAERQRAILKGALTRLAAGGRLVYSTCSLEAEECEQVVEVVAEGGVRRVAVDGLIEGLAERGVLREWGGAGGRRCGMGRCGRCRGCMGAMDFLRWCWSGWRGRDYSVRRASIGSRREAL